MTPRLVLTTVLCTLFAHAGHAQPLAPAPAALGPDQMGQQPHGAGAVRVVQPAAVRLPRAARDGPAVDPRRSCRRAAPSVGAHTLAPTQAPELKTPQDLAGLRDTQPVRYEGRTTTIKALRESSPPQVLSRGSAGVTQAQWTRTVRGQALNIAGGSPAGQLAAANAALRQAVERSAVGGAASDLLRPSSGAPSVQRCNGVDYVQRSAANAPPLAGPRVLNLKQSHIGPGGAVVLNGLCFGASPGRVRLIGNFPGGQLLLSTPVWRHDVVYAEIPQVNGVASHNVVVQLLDARGVLANEMPGLWDTPAQSFEVDSARVWEVAQCGNNQPPFDALCRSGAPLNPSVDAKTLSALLLLEPSRWLDEALPATAIGALHRRIDVDRPVEPFQGRDVYRLKAPAGCVAEKTFWSPTLNAAATGFTATHLDERTVAVDWRADFCVKYGWALDHDWSCIGNYMSRKTVISCPAGTTLP